MSDIVERLRSCKRDDLYLPHHEAADEIKRLRADKAELVAALRNADRMQVADIFALIHKMEGK